jgi:hypothetical protein
MEAGVRRSRARDAEGMEARARARLRACGRRKQKGRERADKGSFVSADTCKMEQHAQASGRQGASHVDILI